MSTVELKRSPYPFEIGENNEVIKTALKDQFEGLVDILDLSQNKKRPLVEAFSAHLTYAENLFDHEEQARKKGNPEANLFYHGKGHAVYQGTYDAIYVMGEILSRKNTKMSAHLTTEGVIATVWGAMYHDSGYVNSNDKITNYAARTPVHVGVSILTVQEAIDEIGLPDFLNIDKIKRLSIIAIHNTHFPYTFDKAAEMRQKLDCLLPEDRKEAHIVRLSSQLSDLGGQVARVDYYPNLVLDLRKELEGAKSGLGDQVIGTTEAEVAQRGINFINTFVLPRKDIMTVGRIANALLGKDNAYKQAWDRHIMKALSAA